jgi:hypothetical protein
MTKMPREFEERLRSLLADLEADTGAKYMLTVHRAGADSDLVIGAFDTRTGLVIADMRPGYEALNGVYDDMAAIDERVLELKYGDMRQPRSTYWRCPRCNRGESGPGDGNYNYASISVYADSCLFCPYWFTSVWNRLAFDVARGVVYTISGGTLSICHTQGSISLL